MEIRLAVQSFLQHLVNEAAVSSRSYRVYHRELERLSQFLLQNEISRLEADLDIRLVEQYYLQRASQLSAKYSAFLARKYKQFFDYLHAQHLIEKEIGLLFPYLAEAAGSGKGIGLLQQVRELEKVVLQAKRLKRIKERFSALKQEIIHVARQHPGIERVLFATLEQEIGKIKAKVQVANDQHLNEILLVGSFLDQKNLSSLQTELTELTKSVSRLGREALKTNAFFENKQEKDVQSFQEMARRLGRLEQLVGELQVLKKEHQIELGLQVAKKLFPVIDGLEGAQAALLDIGEAGKFLREKVRWGHRFMAFGRRTSSILSYGAINMEQWKEGLEIIRQRLLTILADEGIKPVKSLGKVFNPHYHIAVGIEHCADEAEGIIVREQIVGYCRGEQVIRQAEVVVAKRATN